MSSKPTRDMIVAELRSWVNTPFHHQQQVKGVGVDCIQLALAVGQKFGVTQMQIKNYGRLPDSELMVKTMGDVLTRISKSELRPGDLILVAYKENAPGHVAFVSQIEPEMMIIHALSSVGFVREHPISDAWKSHIYSCYRMEGLAD